MRLILSERRLHALNGRPNLELEFFSSAEHSSGKKLVLPVARKNEHAQHLLLATKANDAVDALRCRKNSLNQCRNIVTLCNGMGYHSDIQSLLPGTSVFAVTTTDGAYFRQQQQLVLAGKGTNKIARLICENSEHRRALKWTSSQLSTRGHQLHTRISAHRMLMSKLLINACINGLTAIHNCRNGDLLSQSSIQGELDQLIKECENVAKSAGFPRLASQLRPRVYSVAAATGNNYSSTCMDIKLGRRTEIDYINGYLCDLANQLGLNTPANQTIVSAIQRLEKAGARL